MTEFPLNALQVAQVIYLAASASLSALEISSVRQNQFRRRLRHGEACQEPNIGLQCLYDPTGCNVLQQMRDYNPALTNQ